MPEIINKLRDNIFRRFIAHDYAVAMQLDTERNKVICCDFIVEADTSPQDEFELFKYLYKNGRKNFEPYYIINDKCAAYAEIKAEYGNNIIEYSPEKIVEFANTLKELFKTTKYICGGFQVLHSLRLGITEAVKRSPYVYSIFTQHGITFFKDDFISQASYSSFLFDKLMISNDFEKEIFINRGCYAEENLIKNGLFRWDLLSADNAESEKSIFIYFTHRRYLKNIEESELKNTVYVKTILGLLENPRFKKFVEDNGYTLKIALHHSVLQACGSGLLEGVKILEDDEIADAKKKSAILITDYSSMCFEMWFQHKPSIFLNIPDGEDCIKYGHKTDLADPYGPKREYIFNIVNSVEECMDKLEDYHNTGYKLKPDEKAKRDAFFYHNGDFCKRFYEYLISMKKSVKKLYQMPVNTTVNLARYPEVEILGIEMPTAEGRWIVRKKAFLRFFVPKWDNGLAVQLYYEPFLLGKQNKISVKVLANGNNVCEKVITEQKNGHISFDIPKEYIGSDGKIEIGFRISGVYPHDQLDENALNDKRYLSLRLKDMDIYEKSEKSADTITNLRTARESE
ncbi:MAG: CDP-glycerol glycerophosphotransferase family protein [Ruminococcus sp.]|nr:CDP-glycerol glycerophosphotransferase family protein [Ruminococcus sp.]